MFRFLRDWRRRRLLARAHLDEAAWREACTSIRATRRLTPEQVERLRALTLLFLHEKDFIACDGFDLRDRHRYAIAVQACIPILYLGIEAYHGWRSIYVFPDVMRERDPRSWHDRDLGPDEVAGVAVEGGGIGLAWSEAAAGFDDEDDGYNPVIHEFAHQLDMADGEANGRPPLPAWIRTDEWCETFSAAFEDFCARVDAGEDTGIDDYAATDPSEFFAVCSEVFFEEPELIEDEYPAVAELLRAYYLRPR